MDEQERHFDHPKQEEGQDISGGDAGTRGKVISHVPPRGPEYASQENVEQLRAEI